MRFSGFNRAVGSDGIRRHTPEQIVESLRTVSEELGWGRDIGEVCRKLGIDEATYHRREKQFKGVDNSAVKRFERENLRLKKLVAKQVLERGMLEQINQGK